MSKSKFVLSLVFLSFLLNVVLPGQVFAMRDNSLTSGPEYQVDAYTQEVIDLTNQERLSAGLPLLVINPLLGQAAQSHAEAMANGDFFDHKNPITGSEPGDRITDNGYQWIAYGENIAMGQQTPQDVVLSWMDSEGHRKNILSTDYTEIGVGYFQSPDNSKGPYWVQNFGSSAENAGLLSQQSTTTPSIATPVILDTSSSSSDFVVMTVVADPLEADVEGPISVEIKLSGDSTNCGESVVVKPVDVILVLDHSGSMDGEPLLQAKLAAQAFVNEMDLSVDRVGVVEFSDSASLIQDLSNNPEIINASIENIAQGGGTDISSGLTVAFDVLQANTRADAQSVVVLLSDGQSDALFVADTVKAAGIKLITVGLGDADETALKSYASVDRKGRSLYYASPDPSSLQTIYIAIAHDIREYGLAKDLTLRFQLNVYDFALIPESLDASALVAGDTITWKKDILSSGDTSFFFQAWGRKSGTFNIGQITEATFLECEQNGRSLQIGPGPEVKIELMNPIACTNTCEWWKAFPWWIVATLLMVLLIGLLLALTPLGNFLKSDSVLCKILWSAFYLYLVFLVGFTTNNLLSDLCGADRVYFWKVTQDGMVGVYETRIGSADANPIDYVNQSSNCVACHALGGESGNSKIVVVRDDQNGELIVHTLDGNEVPIAPVNGSYTAWSPDGKEMAISVNDVDIQILDVESGVLTPLAGASDPNVIETMPAWSSDGLMIAFVRTLSVPEDSARLDTPSDIYIVPSSGGAALPLPGASGDGFNYYPAYSPDGKWLAFTRHTTGQDTYGDNAADVYLVPSVGGKRILLRANNDEYSDTWPTWSNNGEWLGFSSNRRDQQFDIFLARIGANGQSLDACYVPGAALDTDEEFHPTWLKPNPVLWWQRFIVLWPWLIPALLLLIFAIWACLPPKIKIVTKDGRTGDRLGGTDVYIKRK
jgi:uncharacterized protein YkwD/uncharacterized protein YegL